jgi:hypothetical protein
MGDNYGDKHHHPSLRFHDATLRALTSTRCPAEVGTISFRLHGFNPGGAVPHTTAAPPDTKAETQQSGPKYGLGNSPSHDCDAGSAAGYMFGPHSHVPCHAQHSPGYTQDLVLRRDIFTGTCAMSTKILPMFPLYSITRKTSISAIMLSYITKSLLVIRVSLSTPA